MKPRPRPCGFTLIEVLLAVVLIDVGLLALVAGGAHLARHATRLRARSAAMRAATNRLQWLATQPCAPQRGSATAAPGVHEAWVAGPPINGVRDVSDSATASVAGTPIIIVLQTRLPC